MRIQYYIFIIYFNLVNSSKSFLFSVIISIYNTEKYLKESINSVINQTIGFNKIQVILVDDGSIDNSGEICKKYQSKYSENIIYVRTNHMGVSKARNIGLKYARGKYINFLDSDDKWDINAFKYVLFFTKFYRNLNIISCRIKYFEANDKYHFLDYKFKSTRVVNLDKEYQYIQLHVSSSFIRYSSIGQTVFDEDLLYGEDVKFISNNIINKRILCFIRESLYYYRKRADSTSAIQNSNENIKFYFEFLNKLHLYLINKSIELFSNILPFIQYYISYEILFRLTSPAYKFLDLFTYKKYCSTIQNILLKIDDKYILEQRIFSNKIKILALSKKYSRDIRNDFVLKNSYIIYSENIIINLNKYRNLITWKIFEIKGNLLHLEGDDNNWLPTSKYSYHCILGNNKIYPKYYSFKNNDFETLYGTLSKGRIISFDISLNIKDEQILYFFISYSNGTIEIFPSLEYLNHLPPLNNSYYVSQNYIIKNHYNRIYIYKNRNQEKIFERTFCFELKNIQRDYLIRIREKYLNKKRKCEYKENHIWLINDGIDKASNNGEYFFRYLKHINPKEIKFYFIISKNSNDYYRLQSLDNIIDYNSTTHLSLFLKADKIITSFAETWVSNPFGEDSKYIRDLFNFDYIYLKNAVVKDDISRILNRIIFNFDLIIVSSKKELNSFLNNDYGYHKDNLVLTGIPRYDNLKASEKYIPKEKMILIFPTWRMYIKGTTNLITQKSIKSETFKNTTYFNFYNDLINNRELINFMKENNFSGIFCLHSKFSEQSTHFNQNEIFKVNKECDMQKLLVKSSLLITDYSSIFFDFAYMQKPIIFTQFDHYEYRKYQFPKGYFDYKTDGFGTICYNIQCTIEQIKLEIKNQLRMKKIYIMRIKRFFKYLDEYNCYRTYNTIKGFKNEKYLKQNNIFIQLNSIFNFIILFFSILKLINIYYYIKYKY